VTSACCSSAAFRLSHSLRLAFPLGRTATAAADGRWPRRLTGVGRPCQAGATLALATISARDLGPRHPVAGARHDVRSIVSEQEIVFGILEGPIYPASMICTKEGASPCGFQ
jgi:hypothetical protein